MKVFAFCLLIVGICYFNAVSLPFVQGDDFVIVVSNPGIRSIAPLRFLSEPYWARLKFGGVYRPLTILSFSIDYSLWHEWAPGYRLTNLLLHALNGYLVFFLAYPLIGSGAWAAAAVYLMHPVHTEAVVGIVGRAELLAAAFFFGAWLLFRRGHVVWSSVAFFLALLSKENAIVLPAILVLDMLLLAAPRGRGWARLVSIGFIAFVYLALRFSVLGSLGFPQAFQYVRGQLTLGQRWMTSGRSFLQYFRLALAPVKVSGSYEFNSIHIAGLHDWDAWAGLGVVFACIGVAISLRRKYPAVSLAILFFFIALLPVSNWIIPTAELVAERFLYLPVFSVAMLAGIAWAALPTKRMQWLLGAGAVLTAAMLCFSHNWIWQDELTYFSNMVRVTPENLSARVGYGHGLQAAGLFGQAREQFEAGLRIDPNSPSLLAALAGLIGQMDPQHCEQTRPLLDRALKAQANHWEASWVLANCDVLKGKPEEADALYRTAVANAPVPDPNIFYSWGIALEALGKRDAALYVYRQAAEISPNDEGVRRKLASLSQGPAH